MEFILTSKVQWGKKCKDDHSRNFLLYFLNGVQILKQKYPFDETFDYGHDAKTRIYDEYLLNGSIHQTRCYMSGVWWRSSRKPKDSEPKPRQVRYPISKKILNELEVPKDLKINITRRNKSE